MTRWALLLVLCCVLPLLAQSVVIVSEDGKSAWFASDASSMAKPVDRIVTLSGDTPPPPDKPTPPSEDKWELAAFSEAAANKVQGDQNRSETAAKLGTAYVAIGKQVQQGAITQRQLKAALELTFRFAAGGVEESWTPWKKATQGKYNSQQFANAAEAGQGVIDIGLGASRTSQAAIEDWLTEFIEKWLPLILMIIKLFSPAEVDALLAGAVT